MSDSQYDFDSTYDQEMFEDYGGDDITDDEANESDVTSSNDYKSSTYNSPFDGGSKHQRSERTSLEEKNSKDERQLSNFSAKDHDKAVKKSVVQDKRSNKQRSRNTNMPGHRKTKSSGYGNVIAKGPSRVRHASMRDGQTSSTASSKSVVVDRVLSANRNKAKALHNVISELQQQIDSLTVENKDLKKVARIQDREIKKLDNAEAELPFLLKKHSNEMHVLQEKYRRQKETTEKAKEELNKRDEELLKTRERLRKYEEMVRQKNLEERSTLSSKLSELEKEVGDKERKIAELTRAVQLHEKVRGRELKEKNDKYKRVVEEMRRLETEQRELLVKLREKEKALQVTNIYSKRLQKYKDPETQLRLIDPNYDQPKWKQKEGNTPRNNMDDLKKAFLTEKSDQASSSQNDPVDSPRQDMPQLDFENGRAQSSLSKHSSKSGSIFIESNREKISLRKRTPRQDSVNKSIEAATSPVSVETMVGEQIRQGKMYDASYEEVSHPSKSTEFLSNAAGLIDEEKALQEIDKKLASMRSPKTDSYTKLDESPNLHFIDKQQELSKVQKELEIEEEIARQRADKKKEDSVDTVLRDEQQGKIGCERKFDEAKPTAVPEVDTKKELLLARMRAIDAGENPDEITESNLAVNVTPVKKKKTPIFLQSAGTMSPKESDNVLPHGPLDFSTNSSKQKPFNTPIFLQKVSNSPKKDKRDPWSFREPDENLHKGLPAHFSPKQERKNSKGSKSSKDSADLNFGSYEPTFLPKAHPPKGNNKDTLSKSNLARKGANFESTSSPSWSESGNPFTISEHKPSINGTDSRVGRRSAGLKSHQSKNTAQKAKNPFDDFDDPFGSSDLTLPWEKRDTSSVSKPNRSLQNNSNSALVFSTDEDEFSDFQKGEIKLSQNVHQHKVRGGSAKRQKKTFQSHSNFEDDLEEMVLI